MVSNLKKIVADYEERLREKPNVPKLSHGRRMLCAGGGPNRMFLTCLFMDMALAIQFMKDVGIIPSKVRCNTCDREMTWCAQPDRSEGFRWRCRKSTGTGARCSGSASINHALYSTFLELKGSICEMEKELSKLQVMKHEYQECCSVLNDECTRLKESEETLKKELHDALAVKQSLKKDIEHLSKETRTSDEDAAILEKNQSLLWLYKNLTGVKWDYTAPSSGYVGSGFNSVKNYCKYFSYPAAEASSECVWDEIQCAAHADWADISR